MLPNWQLQNEIQAIAFDCDGTLSSIEGIDELAKESGHGNEVAALTAEAMGKSGLNPHLYETRLKLVKPQKENVMKLAKVYYQHRTPNIVEIISIFKRLKKSVYIISAGLLPSLIAFGDMLHVPQENIFAVDIQFDESGNYISFDQTSPLIRASGKREIVTQLKKIHPKLIYVGDGLNDYETHDLVTRFIGYGGVFYRQNIANLCQYYIRSLSLAPLLPLSLTANEYEMLTSAEQLLYQEGLKLL